MNKISCVTNGKYHCEERALFNGITINQLFSCPNPEASGSGDRLELRNFALLNTNLLID